MELNLGMLLNAITAFSTLLLLFFTVRHFIIKRKDDMNVYKPNIEIGVWNFGDLIHINIMNSGIHPAYITKVMVCNKEGECRGAIIDWLSTKVEHGIRIKYFNGPRFCLTSNKEYDLIKIPIDETNIFQINQREKYRKILVELTITIIYKDAYNNSYNYSRNFTQLKLDNNEIEIF